MARFEREAQVLASLNHANIACIHGLEESSGIRALVMELVEGTTLAKRIQQGPLPLDEALAVAKQIAEALEYAHERGIIHRDLKPANVKVTPEGNVKVLAFGLAKALHSESFETDISKSPTIPWRRRARACRQLECKLTTGATRQIPATSASKRLSGSYPMRRSFG